MKPLLSNSQMAAIQRVAMAGMKVAVVIKRPVFSSDDLGDEAVDENPLAVVQPSSVLRDGTLFGYLRQTGGDTTGGVDAGAIVTTSTFELGVPFGANVQARDIAVIGGREYRVQDVLDDETWPAMLDITLRYRS